ncbi:MarR family winged helix-turn-helix transcriptional regulator [Paenibacillus sp. SI8]|uniref:MarR family winged helix-turn-helix transcriptional regulator n=1 Tax=unclassified Paenibacillus TaxID=185978 RepID=UPI003466F5E5
MHKQSLESLELEMALLVRRLTSISAENKGNLDRSAYLLLHHIYTCGCSGVKTLAEAFHLDISTVSRQAAALEHKGYVYRIPDPQDGRAYSLQMTDLGKQELVDYKKLRSTRMEEFLKNWSDEECQDFAALLQKFNQTILIMK